MKIEKELYPVFVVDVCRQPYATDDVLVGAESKEDLREHLPEILEEFGWHNTKVVEEVMSEFDWRVAEKEGLYTDQPYKILADFAYYE